MGDHFWINPLGLIQHPPLDGSTVDGREAENNRESRPSRSLSRTPSTEALLKQERLSTFLKSAEVANDQSELVKLYMQHIQYPHLEPESLATHQYEFLNVPEDFITDSATCLLDVLRYLQKYAVTFYQMLQEADEFEIDNPDYIIVLHDTRDKIVRLLCDLVLAIELFELAPGEDITYEMLPDHMRGTNQASQRALRDYLVLRHYMKFLGFLRNQKENFMRLAA